MWFVRWRRRLVGIDSIVSCATDSAAGATMRGEQTGSEDGWGILRCGGPAAPAAASRPPAWPPTPPRGRSRKQLGAGDEEDHVEPEEEEETHHARVPAAGTRRSTTVATDVRAGRARDRPRGR